MMGILGPCQLGSYYLFRNLWAERKVSVENMIQVLCKQFHKCLFNSVLEHPVWSAIFLWHPEREHNSDTDLWLLYPPRSSVYFLGLVHLQYCGAVPFHVLKYMDLFMPLHLHHGEYIEMLPNHRNMFCMVTQLLIKASSSCYRVLSEQWCRGEPDYLKIFAVLQ